MKNIFKKVLENIPDYKGFFKLNELDSNSYLLAYKYPGVVKIHVGGYTRDNRPVLIIKIGTGKKHALMYGCPHPNEPIGTMMLDYFSEALASNKELRDELDYTFIIIKTVDPDGTKLNEGWFKGDLSIKKYAKNFYRPEADKQVDWTFPIKYKDFTFDNPIPETKILMKIIDEYKPEFIYPLHNAGFGGTYWYLSEPLEALYDDLYNASNEVEIPVHLGEPEMPFITKFAPGIFKIVGTKQIYDYMDKYTPDNVSPANDIHNGTCSHEYAENEYTPFSVMTELPYFLDKRVSDQTLLKQTRRESLFKSFDYQKLTLDFIRENLDLFSDFVDKHNNPFYSSIKMYIRALSNNGVNVKMITQNDDYNNPATVAETFDSLIKSKFYLGILAIGVLYRTSLYELEKFIPYTSNTEDWKTLKEANKLALNKLEEIADELESELNYKIIPIKDMIKVQLETGLLILDYLQK